MKSETNVVCNPCAIYLKIAQLVTIISRDEKITHGLFGGPLRLGALGPGPAGPLDKTALCVTCTHDTLLTQLAVFLLSFSLIPKILGQNFPS